MIWLGSPRVRFACRYLQSLDDLELNFPVAFEHMRANFGVQTSAHSYGAMGDDRAVETKVMRFMKMVGGAFSTHVSLLSKGCLATELALTAPASMHAERFDTLCGGTHDTRSDQHDGGDVPSAGAAFNLDAARLQQDRVAMDAMEGWFYKGEDGERNPYAPRADGVLLNLETQQHALPGVNVDDLFSIGAAAIARLAGLQVDGRGAVVYSYCVKTDKVLNMATRPKTSGLGDASVRVDSEALFQRLALVGKHLDFDERCMLSHPLSQLDLALFTLDGNMRPAAKALMAGYLRETCDTGPPRHDQNGCGGVPYTAVVLDLMANVRRCFWDVKGTFKETAAGHVARVLKRYEPVCGRANIHVVADGYRCELTTKSACQSNRAKAVSPDVTVKPEATVEADRETFLSNKGNKQQCVDLLCAAFEAAGMQALQCPGMQTDPWCSGRWNWQNVGPCVW